MDIGIYHQSEKYSHLIKYRNKRSISYSHYVPVPDINIQANGINNENNIN